jgi:hypothetical protein
VAAKRDEVGGREDQIVFADRHLEITAHGVNL